MRWRSVKRVVDFCSWSRAVSRTRSSTSTRYVWKPLIAVTKAISRPIVPPPITVIADSFIWLFLLSLSFQASFYEPSLDTAFQKLGSNRTQKMLSTPSIVLIQNDRSEEHTSELESRFDLV